MKKSPVETVHVNTDGSSRSTPFSEKVPVHKRAPKSTRAGVRHGVVSKTVPSLEYTLFVDCRRELDVRKVVGLSTERAVV